MSTLTFPPRCQNKINPQPLPLQLDQTAGPSAVPLTRQNKQTKPKNTKRQQARGRMDGWLCSEEDWLCSERCTAEHCGSVICHFSLSRFSLSLSVCKQWHSHAPAPASTRTTERLGILSIHVPGIKFKIYVEAPPEMLHDSCVFQSAQH